MSTYDTKQKILDFEKWLHRETNLSENTIRNYICSLTLYFRDYDVITKESFLRYVEGKRNSGSSAQTCNLRINAFNKFLEFMKLKYRLKVAKVPRRLSLENVPSELHYNQLLSFLKQGGKYEYYLWVKVLAGTGARISEFLNFTWELLIEGRFTMRGKGNRYRYFYISQSLQSEISTYAQKNGKSGRFALNRFEEPVTCRGVAQLLSRWCQELEFPKGMFRPHAWRHFFAKQYLRRSNNDIVQLAEFLGHANLETTRIYLLKSEEEQHSDFNRYVNW